MYYSLVYNTIIGSRLYNLNGIIINVRLYTLPPCDNPIERVAFANLSQAPIYRNYTSAFVINYNSYQPATNNNSQK